MANPAWRKGVSGNPHGRTPWKGVAIIYGELLGEFDGCNLSPADRTQLELSARLIFKATKTRDPAAQASCTNAALRIIAGIKKAKAKRKPGLSHIERLAIMEASR
jgi:hypothetical protein